MAIVLSVHEWISGRKGPSVQGHQLVIGREYRIGNENGPGYYRVLDSQTHGTASPLFTHCRAERSEGLPAASDFFLLHGSGLGLRVYDSDSVDTRAFDSFRARRHQYDTPDGMHEALHDLHQRLSDGAHVAQVAEKLEHVIRRRLDVLTQNAQTASALRHVDPAVLEAVVRKSVVHGFVLADNVRILKSAESSAYPGKPSPQFAMEAVARSLQEIVPLGDRNSPLLRVAVSSMGLQWDPHRDLISHLDDWEKSPHYPRLVDLYKRR